MLERFKSGIEVKHNKNDSTKKKNEKRHEAIKEHFSDVEVNKNNFVDYIQRKNLHNNDSKVLEQIKDIDFSKANPRNNSFMNELAFAGQSIAEGFLDVFNIEQNKAIDKYKDQLQVIEQKADNSDSRYFIGTFNGDNLKRLTKYKDRKEELQTQLDERAELSNTKKQDQKQTQTLKREEEY